MNTTPRRHRGTADQRDLAYREYLAEPPDLCPDRVERMERAAAWCARIAARAAATHNTHEAHRYGVAYTLLSDAAHAIRVRRIDAQTARYRATHGADI